MEQFSLIPSVPTLCCASPCTDTEQLFTLPVSHEEVAKTPSLEDSMPVANRRAKKFKTAFIERSCPADDELMPVAPTKSCPDILPPVKSSKSAPAVIRRRKRTLTQSAKDIMLGLSDEELRLKVDNMVDDLKQSFHKNCWRVVSGLGPRNLFPVLFSGSLSHYDKKDFPGVKGLVALTLDDAPCSRQDPDVAMIQEVGDLLREYDAKATFFCTTDFVQPHEDEFREMVADGHEVANHCGADRSYAPDTEKDFEAALLASEEVCERLRAQTPAPKAADSAAPPRRWFRAPHAKLSQGMSRVLVRHGYTNVLGDSYACDPWITDPKFLASQMDNLAVDGSIAIIHMPERGFREYNLEALREFLAAMKKRQIQVVTLSTLHEAAWRLPRV